ncbi:MAG: hypothetical protein LBK47_05720 [Prevotellaceae bacterium]|nr:hypothetical protein [Prevotellaceae bacterium]
MRCHPELVEPRSGEAAANTFFLTSASSFRPERSGVEESPPSSFRSPQLRSGQALHSGVEEPPAVCVCRHA